MNNRYRDSAFIGRKGKARTSRCDLAAPPRHWAACAAPRGYQALGPVGADATLHLSRLEH